MRLTCPNCGAQYEVPDDVIPDEGRDVQCSDCGTTWFQAGAAGVEATITEPVVEVASDATEVEEQAPEGDDAFDAPDADDNPQEDYSTAPDEVAEEKVEETFEEVAAEKDAEDFAPEEEPADDLAEEDEDLEDDEPEPAPQPERARQRGLDTSVADILREEAKREAALRAAEATGLETQPDLGLESPSPDDTEQRAQQTRERMARLRGEDPDSPEEDYSGSRRGLLPDIEEINSSLRGGYEVPAAAAQGLTYDEAPQRRRSGFLRGFTIAILIAVAAAMVYQNSATLAVYVPEAEPLLQSYVDWVNETRVWLHTQVEQLAQQPTAPE
ncbi:zinc-ribbon domain-containing protein [Epibacterium ulvae]|uniref:zinc-ribbon domain-containing protein n=1 Tax=Epibacterium ulvae TaxID=1156985 RepID=UPI001BFCABB0|nr:zinc-ribbon domain-containing protein [Epibacterium ulvae]MBT8154872.1 zinc-ribbon domain-containing protein [Epibacterium ulvae]